MQAYIAGTAVVVKHGDTVQDFRGQMWTFIRPTRIAEPGKSSKVYVQDEFGRGREFYGEVLNLIVSEH